MDHTMLIFTPSLGSAFILMIVYAASFFSKQSIHSNQMTRRVTRRVTSEHSSKLFNTVSQLENCTLDVSSGFFPFQMSDFTEKESVSSQVKVKGKDIYLNKSLFKQGFLEGLISETLSILLHDIPTGHVITDTTHLAVKAIAIGRIVEHFG